MRRLILSLLTLALIAIPVSIQVAPPVSDTFIGLHSGAGVLALRGSPPTEFRVYLSWEDAAHNTGFFNNGKGWRFVVNGADAGSITLNFGAAQTVTTTAAQDASLTRLLAKINAERVAASQPPFATVEDWLKATLIGAVQSYREQAAKADAEDACVLYAAASTATQNAIKTALGGKSPCAN